MAITRKPRATSADNFIENGGSAANAKRATKAVGPDLQQQLSDLPLKGQRGRPKREREEETGVKLRLPTSLLERIDTSVESRKPILSRHQWILEAIYEKLGRG